MRCQKALNHGDLCNFTFTDQNSIFDHGYDHYGVCIQCGAEVSKQTMKSHNHKTSEKHNKNHVSEILKQFIKELVGDDDYEEALKLFSRRRRRHTRLNNAMRYDISEESSTTTFQDLLELYPLEEILPPSAANGAYVPLGSSQEASWETFASSVSNAENEYLNLFQKDVDDMWVHISETTYNHFYSTNKWASIVNGDTNGCHIFLEFFLDSFMTGSNGASQYGFYMGIINSTLKLPRKILIAIFPKGALPIQFCLKRIISHWKDLLVYNLEPAQREIMKQRGIDLGLKDSPKITPEEVLNCQGIINNYKSEIGGNLELSKINAFTGNTMLKLMTFSLYIFGWMKTHDNIRYQRVYKCLLIHVRYFFMLRQRTITEKDISTIEQLILDFGNEFEYLYGFKNHHKATTTRLTRPMEIKRTRRTPRSPFSESNSHLANIYQSPYVSNYVSQQFDSNDMNNVEQPTNTFPTFLYNANSTQNDHNAGDDNNQYQLQSTTTYKVQTHRSELHTSTSLSNMGNVLETSLNDGLMLISWFLS
ncbi:hypothetical protein DFA_03600 [Cavenderia fasciculata]|uniref:Uncharacterized protein n=1 Tax=Cavenderia fasciculata TaxID=261658 RepID=F4PI68_CACFS|nr:uncharacterized protein DFA_03600 [Cavenderia fasciculata]EGG25351.1 hypothetical protein DFA_03600 [Cavenderia fasciculata]|eukprot:XP_004363202.1 hypothetical protein DFA_03600 [Cavenderia fasciculata]